MPGSGLKVCGGWWVVGGVQTHFSDQPKSQADQFIPITLLGMSDAISIPTTFVGLVIPTKLLETVYFDKSCMPELLFINFYSRCKS